MMQAERAMPVAAHRTKTRADRLASL
jgi:hypothetical protein